MSADKLILNKNTSIEEVADYFRDLDPNKQVRARELGDGNIQLYVRKDSTKQFFTDKLKSEFLVKRDYLNARNQIFDMAGKIENTEKKASILFHIRRTLDNHSHNFFVNEFNQSLEPLLNSKNKTETHG